MAGESASHQWDAVARSRGGPQANWLSYAPGPPGATKRLALKPSEPSHQVVETSRGRTCDGVFNIFFICLYMSLYVFICFYMSLFSWNFRNGLDVCIYIYIYIRWVDDFMASALRKFWQRSLAQTWAGNVGIRDRPLVSGCILCESSGMPATLGGWFWQFLLHPT